MQKCSLSLFGGINMSEQAQVNFMWKYVATGLGSFLLGLSVMFANSTLTDTTDYGQYGREKAGLYVRLDSIDKELSEVKESDKELRATLSELNKAIVDLRIEIARWADASKDS